MSFSSKAVLATSIPPWLRDTLLSTKPSANDKTISCIINSGNVIQSLRNEEHLVYSFNNLNVEFDNSKGSKAISYIASSIVGFSSLPTNSLDNSLAIVFHDLTENSRDSFRNYTIYHISTVGEVFEFDAINTSLSEEAQLSGEIQMTFALADSHKSKLSLLTETGLDLFQVGPIKKRARVWRSIEKAWSFQWVGGTDDIHPARCGTITKSMLSLQTADVIASGVITAALRHKLPPLAVAVLDPSGEVIVSKRMDGATTAYTQFAFAKAWTAVSMRLASRHFRDKYTLPGATHTADKFSQMLSMVNITGGKLAPFAGGIIIRARIEDGGHIIGGVGVSGATGDEDEYCALQGVLASGISCVTEPSTHFCMTLNI